MSQWHPQKCNPFSLVVFFSEPCDCSSANTGGGLLRFRCSSATISGEVETVIHFFVLNVCLYVKPVRSKCQCFPSSCLSDAASGLSDGNEGCSTSGGLHEGRSLKRHQRRSVRSRSRHEKTARAKLNVLSVRRVCLNQIRESFLYSSPPQMTPSPVYKYLLGNLEQVKMETQQIIIDSN